MQYLPLFLLFAAALIAGYFYLQRAKNRDATHSTTITASARNRVDPATATPSQAPSDAANATPSDRPE